MKTNSKSENNNRIIDLEKAISFINEVEKLKMIYRQNMVIDGSRQENSAEHSWHIALMAIVLKDFADSKEMDICKVIKMLLIHDIVEIDNGDTFLYDKKANEVKKQNEKIAADRIFGLLTDEISIEFKALWEEFEERNTIEAKYAASIDSMQPLLNHYLSDGVGIKKHSITVQQIIEKKKHISESSEALWEFTMQIIRKSKDMGLYN